jgi:hypothetical protein
MSINDLLAMGVYTALINFRLQYYEIFLIYLQTIDLIVNKLYTSTILKTGNRFVLHIQILSKVLCHRVIKKYDKHFQWSGLTTKSDIN